MERWATFIEGAGLLGAALLFLGYHMVVLRRWQAGSRRYRWTAILGAGLVLVWQILQPERDTVLMFAGLVAIALCVGLGFWRGDARKDALDDTRP